jgi:hypothetical protein
MAASLHDDKKSNCLPAIRENAREEHVLSSLFLPFYSLADFVFVEHSYIVAGTEHPCTPIVTH